MSKTLSPFDNCELTNPTTPWKGECCCICENQLVIGNHPWNKKKFAKGNASDVLGYGCQFPDSNNVVFFDGRHGLCELFQRRKDSK